MFGTPIGNGNSGITDFLENFSNESFGSFPKLEQKERFYSIRNGNWNDPSVWVTASGKVGLLPTAIDDVYVRNVVNCNLNTQINRLYVSGVFTVNTGITFGLNGRFKGTNGSEIINNGTLNFLTKESAEDSISYGIVDFTTTANTVDFSGNFSGNIAEHFNNFRTLRITGEGVKTLNNNITVINNLTILSEGILDLNSYNIESLGTINIGAPNNAGRLFKSIISDSYITSVGIFLARDSFFQLRNKVLLETRNGINWMSNSASVQNLYLKVTTNNQSILTGLPSTPNFNRLDELIIDEDIELTIEVRIILTVLLPIIAVNSNSKLINKGTIRFINLDAAELSMNGGIFDYNTFPNTIFYDGDYTFNLKDTNYRSLSIRQSTVNTIGDTLIDGNLVVDGTGILNLFEYNLTVNGTTRFGNSGSSNWGRLIKNNSGEVIFNGLFLCTSPTTNTIGFGSQNVVVEFRGGLSLASGGATGYNFGNGIVKFTTNNQSILNTSVVSGINFHPPILIEGDISVQALSTASRLDLFILSTLNGDSSNSTFIVGPGNTIVRYRGQQEPMQTGILDTSTNPNTFIYDRSGDQEIKGGVYRNLTLSGGGVKTLMGDVSVLNTYTLDSGTTLDLNGFTLTNP
jgi:hypothetical protein